MDTANGALKNLEGQIESCRQLLTVFQEERGVYSQGRALTKEELAATLDRKTKLVKLFETQRNMLKDLEVGAKDFPEDLKAKRKVLFRTLAGLLEQLIVIDQENERMMRETATTRRPAQALNPFVPRPRPSLQMQLPLMPFGPAGRQPQIFERPQAQSEEQRNPQPKVITPKLDEVPVQKAAAPAPVSQTPMASRAPIREFKAPSVGFMPARPKSHLRVYGTQAPSAALSHA